MIKKTRIKFNSNRDDGDNNGGDDNDWVVTTQSRPPHATLIEDIVTINCKILIVKINEQWWMTFTTTMIDFHIISISKICFFLPPITATPFFSSPSYNSKTSNYIHIPLLVYSGTIFHLYLFYSLLIILYKAQLNNRFIYIFYYIYNL